MEPLRISTKSLVTQYGDANPNIQKIVAGFMQYEAYKGDPEYLEYLGLQRSLSSYNHELDSLTAFIRENESHIREIQDEEVVDKRKISNLATAVKAFEERKQLIQADINKHRARLQELYTKFN